MRTWFAGAALLLFAASLIVLGARVDGSKPPASCSVGPSDSGVRSPVLRVIVKTHSTRTGRFANVVPGVRIDVGIGLPVDIGRDPLTSIVTDASGEVSIDLPWETTDARDETHQRVVWARIVEPGYQERVATVRLSELSEESADPVVLTVIPWRGATIFGSVRDHYGILSGAEVVGYRRSVDGGWRKAARVRATPEKGFTLHVEHDGERKITAASGNGRGNVRRGTAVSTVLDVVIGKDLPHQELHLIGPGVVQGRVVDTLGRPAVGLSLSAVTVDAAATVEAEGLVMHGPDRVALEHRYAIEGRGHFRRYTRTDRAGRFFFGGLREDFFVVRAGEERLTPSPIASDGHDLELRAPDRKHVVVRVNDASGAPVRNVGLLAGSRERGLSDEWSGAPAMMLQPIGGDEELEWPESSPIRGHFLADGRVVFDLSRIGDFDLFLMARGSPVIRRDVHVPSEGGRVDVVLTLDHPGEVGQLVVGITDPAGEPVRENYRVRIMDQRSGLILVTSDLNRHRSPSLWPLHWELPVGDYWIEVESAPDVEPYHGSLSERRLYGEFRAQVTVTPGQETSVDARLGKPGFIELALTGRPSLADYDAVLSDHFLNIDRPDPGGWAEITLFRDNDRPIEVAFLESPSDRKSWGWPGLTTALALGTSKRSEALPTGRFQLTARLPSGRFVSEDVVIAPGETSRVTLDLGDG